jgi:hypothetical protein
MTDIQIDAMDDNKLNKKFLLFRKISILLITLIVCFLAIVCLYFLSEKYFFDKLFYQKSLSHGYYEFWANSFNDWQLIAEKFNKDQRNTDLLNLIFAEQGYQEEIAYFAEERKDSTFKIAVIGDSFLFGTGVRKNQSVPFFLEKILNKNKRVRVYNYSYAGEDLLDNHIKYELVKKHLNPDLVVLGLVDNDLIFDSFTKYPGKENLKQELEGLCQDLDLVEWRFEDRGKVGFDSFNLVVRPSFQDNTQNICFLNHLSKNFSREDTVLLILSCTDDIYKKFLRAFGQEMPVVDSCDIETKWISNIETHYNASTNFKIAKKLADFIIKKYPIFQ